MNLIQTLMIKDNVHSNLKEGGTYEQGLIMLSNDKKPLRHKETGLLILPLIKLL